MIKLKKICFVIESMQGGGAQKNLYNLELQRQKKIEGTSENFNLFSIGTLNYNKED